VFLSYAGGVRAHDPCKVWLENFLVKPFVACHWCAWCKADSLDHISGVAVIDVGGEFKPLKLEIFHKTE